MAEQRSVLGVDLGGTKVVAGVVGPDGTILGRSKRPTPSREGGPAILQAIVETAHEALDAAGTRAGDLAGVGVGSPGPLDTARGVILFSANLNVKDFALGPDLAAALGRPVIVRNDVRAGGYGEFKLGAGRGYTNLLAVFVGTSIGGCVIVDGRVVDGATGNAGEVGHVVLKANGPECGCGRRGCMEALASRTAITRRIYKAIKRGEPSTLALKLTSKSSKLKSRELAAAFEAGDIVAVSEVRRAAHFLGLGLGGLINVLGPRRVIVGGGVAEALGEPYLAMVRASTRSQVLFDPEETIEIEPAALGDDAGLIGAALMAREQFAPAAPGG